MTNKEIILDNAYNNSIAELVKEAEASTNERRKATRLQEIDNFRKIVAWCDANLNDSWWNSHKGLAHPQATLYDWKNAIFAVSSSGTAYIKSLEW